MDTVDALRNSSLLAALGEEQLAGLAAMARQRTFPAGDVLISAGDSRASAMYVIVDGAVEIRSEGTVVAELGPGAAVGELALLSPDTSRTADVVATEDTTVVALARAGQPRRRPGGHRGARRPHRGRQRPTLRRLTAPPLLPSRRCGAR